MLVFLSKLPAASHRLHNFNRYFFHWDFYRMYLILFHFRRHSCLQCPLWQQRQLPRVLYRRDISMC